MVVQGGAHTLIKQGEVSPITDFDQLWLIYMYVLYMEMNLLVSWVLFNQWHQISEKEMDSELHFRLFFLLMSKKSQH